jgi:hypothetical protein
VSNSEQRLEVYEQLQGNDVGYAGRDSISMHNASAVLD